MPQVAAPLCHAPRGGGSPPCAAHSLPCVAQQGGFPFHFRTAADAEQVEQAGGPHRWCARSSHQHSQYTPGATRLGRGRAGTEEASMSVGGRKQRGAPGSPASASRTRYNCLEPCMPELTGGAVEVEEGAGGGVGVLLAPHVVVEGHLQRRRGGGRVGSEWGGVGGGWEKVPKARLRAPTLVQLTTPASRHTYRGTAPEPRLRRNPCCLPCPPTPRPSHAPRPPTPPPRPPPTHPPLAPW